MISYKTRSYDLISHVDLSEKLFLEKKIKEICDDACNALILWGSRESRLTHSGGLAVAIMSS